MKELLFENPLPLYVILAVAELVIVGLWYRARTRRLAVALLVPLLLAGAVTALDLLVQTDREKIQAICRTIAADVEQGNLRGAEPYLADDFAGYYGSPRGAIDAGQKAWKSFGIRKVDLSNVQVAVTDEIAKVSLRTFVTFNMPGFGEGRQSIDWTVHWALRNGQWKIYNVEEPKIVRGL